jgi:transposase
VAELVDEVLDLSGIYASYQEVRGYPPYDPRLMVRLLIYGYTTGVRSSRAIERKCVEDVAFRFLAADQAPDYRSIARFRRRHLDALADLFMQSLRLAQRLGMVRMGRVALDGTKLRANASKHKAMSYARLVDKEQQVEGEGLALAALAVVTMASAANAAPPPSNGTRLSPAQAAASAGVADPKDLRLRPARVAKVRANFVVVWNIVNDQTHRCLDSNAQTEVYTLGCNNGDFQDWYWSGISLVDYATGKCLDSNAQHRVYAITCNGGLFQKWLIRPPARSHFLERGNRSLSGQQQQRERVHARPQRRQLPELDLRDIGLISADAG